jgi:UPF0176 protein
MSHIVVTFYQFVYLSKVDEWQLPLLTHCQTQGIKGTILLAHEGINGTIAGSRQGIDAVLGWLRSRSELAHLTHKESTAPTMPFDRLKVRLKQEIVTLGVPVDPTVQVGTYVEPKDWNTLIADPEVLLIDTRNHYEVEIGTFEGAQNPQTTSFRDFPQYVENHLDPKIHKKIAMFCTGGIRCEKASSYLLNQGFEQVYHLKGGILKYLEEVPAAESQWQGECFVFDQRVAMQQGLALGTHDSCLSCGHPIAPSDKQSEHYEAGISCPYCYANLTTAKRLRQEAKRLNRKQSQQRNQINAGIVAGTEETGKV